MTPKTDSQTPTLRPGKRLRVGPGLLVTAAFIGPGTVVTASKAGAQFGCQLLWTILFACIGTIVLQSLAARVGIITGTGLGESIRRSLYGSRWLRPAIALVIGAIGIGNAAYQTGNLTGAVSGIASITGGGTTVWVVALAALTTIIVSLGRYRVLHGVLVSLVVLLSL
jgi:manganese transport protein